MNSSSLHKDLYDKKFKYSKNFIPIKIIQNIINEEDLDPIIAEMFYRENFEKSETENEAEQSIAQLNYTQQYYSDDPIVKILDNLKSSEANDPEVQALFKRPRQRITFTFLTSKNYSELPKTTIRTNDKMYQSFKPNNFRDVPSLYQNKLGIYMTGFE